MLLPPLLPQAELGLWRSRRLWGALPTYRFPVKTCMRVLSRSQEKMQQGGVDYLLGYQASAVTHFLYEVAANPALT